MADTARQTSEAFGDLEFEYNLKQLLDKDPIAALGFDPAKASYTVPQGDKYGTKYSREEDTLFYGPDTGSSKDILVHEFRHRGHQLLRNEIEKNPKAFVEKYGQDVVDFLTGKFSETEGKLYPGDRQEEFRTELSDNLEATFKKPRPSEEKLLQGIKDSLGDSANLFNDEELMALAVKNYVKNVDNTGYVKDTTELVTKEDQEKYKNILTKVRQAASDILQQRKGYDQGGTVGKVLDFLTSPLTGDYRKKEPLSVQMADVGVEFTPAGTIFGINDIKEELQKEEPDYYKIGMMAGAEAVGLIPGLGDAAVAAIKAGAKKAGLDNVANQVDSLLSGPKADDAVKTEVFGGVGMKGVSTDPNFKMAQKLLKKKIKSRKSSDLTAAADQKALTEGPIPRIVNKEIWEETGWFVNPLDGQWRYYLDDRDSVLTSFEEIFKPNGEFNFKQLNQSNLPEDQAKKVTLGNLLQHNNLYERYPDLKDREIYFFADNSESGKKLLGRVTNQKIYINLAGEKYKDFEDIHDVLLHEIQHVIQRKEGFVPGASETQIPEELVVKRDSEIANLRKPIQAEVDQLKREEAAIRGRILEEVENAKTPLPGLTAEQELEIFRAKPYNPETMDTEGPSWAALGREYGVSPKIAQKAWGRVNMLDHLRGKEKELDQAIAMKQAELFGLDNESFNIETNFYEGAGGEIEARTVQSMFRGAGDGEFPLDTQTNMLSVERPTVFKYRGDEGVDAINYEQKPRKEPEKAQTSSILEKIRNKVGLAEGGEVAMNQQMSFAFEDGGLRDDGMEQDPVSGNEVPPGSTAKEVRDDIPAQLSEGEYVVPADVVRYYGVKFFEDLRDRAKMGLQDMEARGRIGGEPVPAGGPMNDEDLSPEEMAAIREMMGMAEGGTVNMYKQQQDLYSAPNQAVGNNMMNTGGQVRGYNSSSVVTNPTNTGQNVEQQILTAGQQAQQNPFTPAPLGSSLFQPAGTKMAEITTPKTFTPVKMINLQTNHSVMANTQKEFDDYVSKGYIVDDGTLKPKGEGSGGSGDGGGTTTETEPYKEFVNSVQWNSEKAVMEFINGVNTSPMDKDKSNTRAILGGIAGGIPGAIIGGLGAPGTVEALTNIAQLRATQMVAKAKGFDGAYDAAEKAIADIIKNSPGVIDKLDDYLATGKGMFAAIEKSEVYQSPTVAATSGDDDTGPSAARLAQMERAKENDWKYDPDPKFYDKEPTGSLASTVAAANAAAGNESPGGSGGSVSSTITGAGTAEQEVSGGTQAEQEYVTSAAAGNKGGLMNKAATKKKAKRQYRKGGLANKK